MSHERRLLAACMASRKAYATVSKHVPSSSFTEPAKLIVGVIDEYYGRDPEAQAVDGETLAELVSSKVKNPKHRETFRSILEAVSGTNVSAINVEAEVLAARREAIGAELAAALAAGKSGTEVRDLLDSYIEVTSSESLEEVEEASDLLVAPKIGEVFHGGAEDNLIRLYPRSLNDRLDGGCLRGHHVIVFGRPEIGKTMLTINLCYGFLQQNLRVLYVGNEEPISDTVVRIMGRLTGKTKQEVFEDPDEAYAHAMQRGYQGLYVQRLTPGTLRELEDLVVDVKPDVLIVDQIRNIETKEDNLTRNLEKAAQGVRRIAGKHNCLAVSITQAGDSASNKVVLDMGDVDSSNTGIPAQADVMIGIGASRDDLISGRRTLSLPKNKRSGNHTFFAVKAEPELSRITSME